MIIRVIFIVFTKHITTATICLYGIMFTKHLISATIFFNGIEILKRLISATVCFNCSVFTNHLISANYAWTVSCLLSVLLCDHLACNDYKRCISLISGFNHRFIKPLSQHYIRLTLFKISIDNNQIFSSPKYSFIT